jgi:hypothetical protein
MARTRPLKSRKNKPSGGLKPTASTATSTATASAHPSAAAPAPAPVDPCVLLIERILPNECAAATRLHVLDRRTLSAENRLVVDAILASVVEEPALPGTLYATLGRQQEYFAGLLEGWNEDTFEDHVVNYNPALHRNIAGVILVSPN